MKTTGTEGGANKKILIAEDEKPMVHALELTLSCEGCHVVVVGNGEQALQELSNGGVFFM